MEENMKIIQVSDLTKDYEVPNKGRKRFAVKKEKSCLRAVDHIDLQIEKGSCVGFIGPNGAGKSTTIKMLTGILKPTGGTIRIDGLDPWAQRKKYVRKIGVVFENRSQLWWDLPVIESFDLLKEVYNIPDPVYQANKETFTEILDLGKLLERPVRQLSLGQRMRCEVAASFLHDPEIVFLDEPTIGLDLVAKDRIREFVAALNKEKGVTILLTSHDISDIEKICNDLIIIDRGKVVLRKKVTDMGDVFGKKRFIHITYKNDLMIQDSRIQILEQEEHRAKVVIDLDEISISAMMNEIMKHTDVTDISIAPTPIEEIVKTIYMDRGRNVF